MKTEEKTTTNIIATIGPASYSKEILSKMVDAHMDFARLNFSWGNYEWFKEAIHNIRQVTQKKEIYIPIIQDLSGPRVQEEDGHHFGGENNSEIITEKDKKDLIFGIEQGVDYIAMSFVGSKENIIELKKLIKENGGHQKIIAKIERKVAVENLVEIINESDVIMVARGDLGNEFPLEEIPFIQHKIIRATKEANYKKSRY